MGKCMSCLSGGRRGTKLVPSRSDISYQNADSIEVSSSISAVDSANCKHSISGPCGDAPCPPIRELDVLALDMAFQKVAKQHSKQQPSKNTKQYPADVPRDKKQRLSLAISRNHKNIRNEYNFGRELGRGQYGVTYLCVHKVTGENLACKVIPRRKLRTKNDVDEVQNEVIIMQRLAGHPNIVEFKGTYEDEKAIYIIMELCAGGELFDRIIEKGYYTEKAAADACRVMVKVVQHCHARGVMHRDLKPENFLLTSKDENAILKATDFGLSTLVMPGVLLHDTAGSAYYIAPEVLRRNYGPQADMWSAGVILYILLCGVPPFWAGTEEGIFKAILYEDLDFESEPWPSISSAAKNLISKMLDRNPSKRITANAALEHPWLREDGTATDMLLNEAVKRIRKFNAANKLKKAALQIVAANSKEHEIKALKDLFESIDVDNSGSITFEELKIALAKQGYNLAESEVKDILDSIDIDHSGTIDYLEFISATIQLSKMEKGDHLYAAFQHFDTDDSGYITMEELHEGLEKHGVGIEEIEEIIREVDTDHDGKIDYDEFVAMMTMSPSNKKNPLDFPVGKPMDWQRGSRSKNSKLHQL